MEHNRQAAMIVFNIASPFLRFQFWITRASVREKTGPVYKMPFRPESTLSFLVCIMNLRYHWYHEHEGQMQTPEALPSLQPLHSHGPGDNAASDLYTVAGAASLLRLNPQTIRKWIRAGRCRAYGRPGCYRVRLEDVLPQVPVAREHTECNCERQKGSWVRSDHPTV
jgi:excisionase family DNA binding protein